MMTTVIHIVVTKVFYFKQNQENSTIKIEKPVMCSATQNPNLLSIKSHFSNKSQQMCVVQIH